MVGLTLIIALAGVLCVFANHVQTLIARSSVFPRQITSAQVPSACNDSCNYPLRIYQACASGDTKTCTSVCGTSNYIGFVGCLQCILDNSPGVTQGEVSALNSVVQQIEGACRQIGTVLIPQSFTVPVTGSATSSSASSVTSSLSSASFKSTFTTSRPVSSLAFNSGLVPSLSSAISSAAAASSSRSTATTRAVYPRSIEGALLALVGIAGGAAMIV